jgi:hypothetical protein
MNRALLFTSIILSAALVVFAVYILNARCEGFGCVGIGIAWMMWVVVFCVALIVSLVARSKLQRESNSMRRAASITFFTNFLLGAALLAYYLFKRFSASS